MDVSVVIPYYNDQRLLTLLLKALAQQRCDHAFEVVVADDGSITPPIIPPDLHYPCTAVRQVDQGFRAAAARNLGAAQARGRWLLFLDGDTLPAADYVQTMVRRLRAVDDGHGALVLGRRRHADFATVGDDVVLGFLRDDRAAGPDRGGASAIQVLEEPQWLSDGYARTDHLAAASDEDFRLVISAVLGVDRALWAAVGGFDETFVGYGGEDWDFGWRAWLAGATFAHEPAAVAWHDGRDAGARDLDVAAKNAESLLLASKIPLPSVRGTGLILVQPDIVVRYLGPTTGTPADAAVVASIGSLLTGIDGAVWFPRPPDPDAAAAALPPLLDGDPRVHLGDVPSRVLGRARYQVSVQRPLRLSAPLDTCCSLGEWSVPGLLEIRRTRSISRGDPAPTGVPFTGSVQVPAVRLISDAVFLERWWGGW
jgi:GT2 family glycosyltransferase